MLRRGGGTLRPATVALASAAAAVVTTAAAVVRRGSTAADTRRILGKVREEAHAQSLDLADMADATRAAQRSVQRLEAAGQTAPGGTAAAEARAAVEALRVGLGAYAARLCRLQAEARALEADAEAAAVLAEPAADSAAAAVPEVEVVEPEATPRAVPSPEPDAAADAPVTGPLVEEQPVETVEPERVAAADATAPVGSGDVAPGGGDLEVELEAPDALSEAEALPVADITRVLYERGVDFSDCRDTDALRRRYSDALAGKFDPTPEPPRPRPAASQPPPPPPPPSTPPPSQPYYSSRSGVEGGGADASAGAVAHDPHPGAQRKLMDPMRRVWDMKQEIAADNGIDPAAIDIWCGPTRLDDDKRLYEYPELQNQPLEVRNKGDVPSGRY